MTTSRTYCCGIFLGTALACVVASLMIGDDWQNRVIVSGLRSTGVFALFGCLVLFLTGLETPTSVSDAGAETASD
jgi:hypothetical protein